MDNKELQTLVTVHVKVSKKHEISITVIPELPPSVFKELYQYLNQIIASDLSETVDYKNKDLIAQVQYHVYLFINGRLVSGDLVYNPWRRCFSIPCKLP